MKTRLLCLLTGLAILSGSLGCLYPWRGPRREERREQRREPERGRDHDQRY